MAKCASSIDQPSQKTRKSKYDKFWRTPKLAEPKHHREKYDYPIYQYKCAVRPSALAVDITRRNEHIALPPVRRLKENKKCYDYLGPYYEKTMDKKIAESWDTIYHYYDRLQAALGKKTKKKGPKSKGERATTLSLKSFRSGMSTKEKLALFEKWSEKNAKSKKVFPPEPIDRGRIADLDEIKDHIVQLGTPKPVPADYLPPRELPIPVTPAALHGEVPSRSLALYYGIHERRVSLPKPMGVSPAALKYILTDRTKELSVPKTKREKRDMDLKENPFSISPAALKYKATDRIIQLAKPLERD